MHSNDLIVALETLGKTTDRLERTKAHATILGIVRSMRELIELVDHSNPISEGKALCNTLETHADITMLVTEQGRNSFWECYIRVRKSITVLERI